MVALVVLSSGMLGIASLYGQALGAGRAAELRNVATDLAADMAGRIRANRLGHAHYGNTGSNQGCDPESGGRVDCTPEQMAAHDLFVWGRQVRRSLPSGVGTVQFGRGTSPPSFTIQVGWDEVGLGRETHQLVLQVARF